VAYAEAMGCRLSLLVYPKELDRPFNEKPGNIRVKSAIFDIGEEIDKSGKDFLDAIHSETA
jgi:hypothetical protein